MKKFIFPLFLSCVSTSYAFDEQHLDAHVHGLVEMTLVAEENTVEVSIDSPLMNLTGFEHQAHTQEEKAALKKMAAIFNDPEKWLVFDDSSCRLKQQSVNYGEQLHHDHQHEDTSHADLEASYQFICNKSAPNSIDILLQNYFIEIESISLSWIVDNVSGIVTLHHGETRVHFAP